MPSSGEVQGLQETRDPHIMILNVGQFMTPNVHNFFIFYSVHTMHQDYYFYLYGPSPSRIHFFVAGNVPYVVALPCGLPLVS